MNKIKGDGRGIWERARRGAWAFKQLNECGFVKMNTHKNIIKEKFHPNYKKNVSTIQTTADALFPPPSFHLISPAVPTHGPSPYLLFFRIPSADA
jgi:hypothetical protein